MSPGTANKGEVMPAHSSCPCRHQLQMALRLAPPCLHWHTWWQQPSQEQEQGQQVLLLLVLLVLLCLCLRSLASLVAARAQAIAPALALRAPWQMQTVAGQSPAASACCPVHLERPQLVFAPCQKTQMQMQMQV